MSTSFIAQQNIPLMSHYSSPSTAGFSLKGNKILAFIATVLPNASVPDGMIFGQHTLSPRRLHPAFDITRWLCAVFHIGLIALLAAFAFRQPDKADPRIILFNRPSYLIYNNETESIGRLMELLVEIAYGWIVVGWTVILTFTTQRLARRRQLNLLVSLTSTHDANEAWMSMGAALLSLPKCRQLGFWHSLSPIILPLAYLCGIASLHSVAINMFDFAPMAVNTTTTFNSTGIPDFSGNAAHNIMT
ncbi:hypothetical protein GYMLUDRAFT_54397 [Collybiopsis luxurians FD-317 M1]|nr:hypothetical protein GYMLUDRAFT_54397 [Collybiopsis luxurians FD-317 M1]